jgi:hypothetical protein
VIYGGAFTTRWPYWRPYVAAFGRVSAGGVVVTAVAPAVTSTLTVQLLFACTIPPKT